MENLQEELILSQLIRNVYYREKVLPNLKSEYFEDSENERLFNSIEKQLNEKVVVLDKTTLLMGYRNEEKVDEVLEISFENDNIDYLINNTEKWTQQRSINNGILKCAEIIHERKDLSVIDGIIKDALSVSFDKDLGMDYQLDIESRFERYALPTNSLKTNYTMLDYFTNGGLQRKTLTIILGESGIGKSHVLCNLTTNLNAGGYNGIYLTLELDKEVIGRRCDAINTQIPYFNLIKEKERATNILKKLKGGNTFIKQYPSSKATCVNIRTYLKELEIHKKYKPDFLVVDSLNLMRPNGKMSADNMYNFYAAITIELREIAIELDIPILTAIHIVRSAYGAADISQEDVRGSLGVMEFSDLSIALIQTQDQQPENLITFKVIKNRLGRKNGKIETQINPETLKITEIITSADRELLNNQRTHAEVVELNRLDDTDLNNLLKDSDTIESTSFDDFS